MGIFTLFTANLVLFERPNGQKCPQSEELFALFSVSLNSYPEYKYLKLRNLFEFKTQPNSLVTFLLLLRSLARLYTFLRELGLADELKLIYWWDF